MPTDGSDDLACRDLDRLVRERVLGLPVHGEEVPPYSTDWDAAEPVRRICAAHSMSRRDGSYRARVAIRRERYTRLGEGAGDTPPLALCRAALASVAEAERARRLSEQTA